MGTLQRPRVIRGLSAVAVTIILGGAAVATAPMSSATTFNVINTNDTGPGSLRQALIDAASNAGADTVNVQAGLGTIAVTSELSWNGSGAVTIEGNDVTVNFGGAPRGFVDAAGTGVDIESMTITGVTGSGSDDQAPIVSEGGAVTAGKCTITGNNLTSDDGDVAGGILSEGGPVTVNACTITGNTAHGDGDGGGGVNSEGGNIDISNSTISGNTAVATGDAAGGVLSEGGNLIITGSHINCNSATGGGDAAGGILSEGGDSFTIRTSDIVGNTATVTSDGSAVNSIQSFGTTPVINDSTVSDDTASCAPPATTTTTAVTTTTAPPAATQAVDATPAFTG